MLKDARTMKTDLALMLHPRIALAISATRRQNGPLRSNLRVGEIDTEAISRENAILYANDAVSGVYLARAGNRVDDPDPRDSEMKIFPNLFHGFDSGVFRGENFDG